VKTLLVLALLIGCSEPVSPPDLLDECIPCVRITIGRDARYHVRGQFKVSNQGTLTMGKLVLEPFEWSKAETVEDEFCD